MNPIDPKHLPRYNLACSMDPVFRKQLETACKVRQLVFKTRIIYGHYVGWDTEVTIPDANGKLTVSFEDHADGAGAKTRVGFGVSNALDISRVQLWELINVFARPKLQVIG